MTIVLAPLAAAAYGVASALQSHEARKTAPTALRGLVAVLARPLWWAGAVADIVGLSLHVGALGVGPAAIVQPVQVNGLLMALPLVGDCARNANRLLSSFRLSAWRRRGRGVRVG